jgi:hypothetical protein
MPTRQDRGHLSTCTWHARGHAGVRDRTSDARLQDRARAASLTSARSGWAATTLRPQRRAAGTGRFAGGAARGAAPCGRPPSGLARSALPPRAYFPAGATSFRYLKTG